MDMDWIYSFFQIFPRYFFVYLCSISVTSQPISLSRGHNFIYDNKLIFQILNTVVRRGPPREKGDGVIEHILERENGNWMKIIA